MGLYSRRLSIVVTVDVLAQANASAKQVDTAGSDAFVVGLSATGLPPATHYWTGWQMQPGEDTSLRIKLKSASDAGKAWVYAEGTLDEACKTLGLRRVETVV